MEREREREERHSSVLANVWVLRPNGIEGPDPSPRGSPVRLFLGGYLVFNRAAYINVEFTPCPF